MAVLIDTDILIDVERGEDADAIYSSLGEEECGISVVTMSELLHGVERASGARREAQRATTERVLSALPIFPITDIVARTHARIWAGLALRGDTLGPHDMWIAATAVTLGFGVATRNARDFRRVPGLRVVAVPR